MYKIAEKFKLDPKKDYEKIEQMSQDPSITSTLKQEIEEGSLESYSVTEIAFTEKKPTEIKKRLEEDFFKRFDIFQQVNCRN